MKKLTLLTAMLLATTTFAQIPNYVPTNGLVGWWPFNGNANDESSNGNNGTVNGAALTSDRNGVANMAYSFDGNSLSGNFIECSTSTSINTLDTEMSISVWINPASYSTTYHPRIIDRSFGLGGNMDRWFLTWTPQNVQDKLEFAIENSSIGINSVLSNYSLTINQWVNVVITFEQGFLTYYINGVLNNFGSLNNGSLNHVANQNLFFGSSNGNNSFFNGKLDDIGIWNRALTDCEIKNLYNGGVPNSSQTQTALDTYTWPVNNQTYTQSGTYSDTLVNAAGCDSIVTLNLTLSYTGINELNASQLVVSPNPTKDNFSISGLELLGTITSLELKDAAGKVVKVLNPTATNFSCVGLKAGVYFLAVTSNKTERIIKIIKE